MSALSASQHRVLRAVVVLHEITGRATVRSVAWQAGYRSPGSVHGHLQALRRLGLVEYVGDAKGTLRPAAGVVLIGGELCVAEAV